MPCSQVNSRVALSRNDYFRPAACWTCPATCCDPVSAINSYVGSLGYGSQITHKTASAPTRHALGTNVAEYCCAGTPPSGTAINFIEFAFGTTVNAAGTLVDGPDVSSFTARLTAYCGLTQVGNPITITHSGGPTANTAPYIGISCTTEVFNSVVLEIFQPGQTTAPTLAHDDMDIVAAAGVCSDPHFYGLACQKYDVMGEPGKKYSVLSDSNIQINALFAKCPIELPATHMSQMGIKLGKNNTKDGIQTIFFHRGKPTINGKKYRENEVYHKVYDTGLKRSNGSSVSGYFTYDPFNNALVIDAGGYWMRIFWENFPEYGWCINMALNISDIGILADGVYPHGLLGCTGRIDMQKGLPRGAYQDMYRQGEGVIQGHYSEYEVNHLFSDNFIYNKFQSSPEKEPKYGFNPRVKKYPVLI